MPTKRYYWLKLQDGFFGSKRIKKLRKLAGGDTYTIIYLKMQLLAMKTEGILRWTGLEDDFASELALDLDEEPENVAVTLQYLLSCGLAESDDNVQFFLPYAVENTGSETASTQRSRECRARSKMLQCNTDATLPQHNATQPQQTCNVEKEIEIEIEKEVDTRTRTRDDNQDDEGFSVFWGAYPKKSGDIKAAYMEYIHAIDTGATQEQLLEAVKWQSEEWKAEGDPRYIPSPEKWLKNRRWEEPKRERKPKQSKTSPAYVSDDSVSRDRVDNDELKKILDRI